MSNTHKNCGCGAKYMVKRGHCPECGGGVDEFVPTWSDLKAQIKDLEAQVEKMKVVWDLAGQFPSNEAQLAVAVEALEELTGVYKFGHEKGLRLPADDALYEIKELQDGH